MWRFKVFYGFVDIVEYDLVYVVKIFIRFKSFD